MAILISDKMDYKTKMLLNKWEASHVHGLKDLMLLRQQHSANPSADSARAFLPHPNWLLCRNWQADPKTHVKIQGTENSQNTSEKKKKTNKARGLTFPDFKT